MKKITALILIVVMVCASVPQLVFAQTAEHPVLIYLEKDFEAQNAGDRPYGFYFDNESLASGFEITTESNAAGKENKVLKVSGTESASYARNPWHHAPVTKSFVVDMKVKFDELTTQKFIQIYLDALKTTNTNWLHSDTGFFNLATFSDTLAVNGTQIDVKFEENVWYNIQFAIDMDKRKITTYIDGKKNELSVSMPSFTNLCEFRIVAPTLGGDYYIDDLRIYESSELLCAKGLEQAISAWRNSPLCPPEKYEVGRLYLYDKFTYYTIHNKFLARVGSHRIYKDNKIYNMPGRIYEENGRLIAPIRGLGDVFGAKTEWDAKLQKVTVTYGTKKLEIKENEYVYFVNGRPYESEFAMTNIKGSLYVPLDVLVYIFDAPYKRQDELLNFGEDITFDRDLGPMVINARARTYEQEIMLRINLFLQYNKFTADDILERYYEYGYKKDGLRVVLDSFEEVKQNMEKDPEYAKVVRTIIGGADATIAAGNVQYTLRDGVRGSFPQPIYNMGMGCSFAYKITGDTKYLDFIKENIKIIDTTFPDFYPYTNLGLGNSANGIGPMYDWLKDDLDEYSRTALERILYEYCLKAYERAFSSPTLGDAAFTTNQGNQPIIINNGLIGCAVAFMDKYPEFCAELIACALHSLEEAYMDFAPDGGWEEGLSYWQYTFDTLTYTISTLENVFGYDFGLSEAIGLDNTVYYALATRGSVTGFAWGDAVATSPFHGMFMWHANRYKDYGIAALRKNNMNNVSMIDLVNWVFDTDNAGGGYEDLKTDTIFSKVQEVTMRTGWQRGDTAVSFHGGGNDDGHGHWDVGSFQFDMSGVRWATDLEKEDYNLRDVGAYDANKAPANYKYNGADYYRQKMEGHNMVIAGLGTTRYDTNGKARGNVVKHEFGETMSYAIMNVTQTNDIYDCAIRGIKLDKIENEIIIEDNFKAKSPTEFWWSMHTQADVEISEDGKSAILSQNGSRIWASIISEGSEVFQVLPAAPMREFTIDGITFPPSLQTPNDGFRKLAVQNATTDHFKLAIAFKPLVGDENLPTNIPEYVPMERWKITNSVKGELNSVMVNGEVYDAFNPEVYNYNLDVITEKSDIPKIEVFADLKYEVEVIETKSIPGVTNVRLKENGEICALYSFLINPLNDTTKFLNERQIPIVGYTVSSEPQAENNAGNLFDANHSTRFSTDEIGGTVTIDFGEVKTVKEIMMRFLDGAERKEFFKVEYSADGINFTQCYDGSSSGTTSDYESYDLGNVDARYLRVSYFGNDHGSNWVSVTELCAFTQ